MKLREQRYEVERKIELSKVWELRIKGSLRPRSKSISYFIGIYGLPFRGYVKGKVLALSEYEAKELAEAIKEIQKELEEKRQESEIIEEVK